MNNKRRPKIDSEKLRPLIYSYFECNSNQTGLIGYEIYSIIEPLLRWAIRGNLLSIYSPKMKKMVRHKLHIALNKKVEGDNSRLLNDIIYEEYYLTSFLHDDCIENMYIMYVPFMDVLGRLTLTKIEDAISIYQCDIANHLAVKFIDLYVSFILQSISHKNYGSEISLEEKAQLNTLNLFDLFCYKYNLFSCQPKIIDTKFLKEHLSDQEFKILHLILYNYKNKEIAQTLRISEKQVSSVKGRIKRKLSSYV